MQEMAVLEGLYFTNFQGKHAPRPPVPYKCQFVISPPLQNARSAMAVETKNSKLFKHMRSMWHRTYSTWKIVPFESSLCLLHMLNGLKMQGMAVLEGPDLKVFRGRMPLDPPGACLPALGPLFTNFLDLPLNPALLLLSVIALYAKVCVINVFLALPTHFYWTSAYAYTFWNVSGHWFFFDLKMCCIDI